jgi:hypothetical protein
MQIMSTRTTMRGVLAILAILIFSIIYYIIADNKKNRRAILLFSEEKPAKNSSTDELPFLFAVFLLLLAGMPILR